MNQPSKRNHTKEEVMKALRLFFEEGKNCNAIAIQLSMHPATVSRIVGGLYYQEVYREYWREHESK